MKKIIIKTLKYLLILVALLLIVVLFLYLYPISKPLSQKADNNNYTISNISIVDVANDSVIKNQTIVIKNNRIIKISLNDSISKDIDTKIIDGTNKYALAGLWDMHSHLAFQIAPQAVMPLHIANGVTNIRDMQGVVNINQDRLIWRMQINSGELLGPRLIGFADEMVGGNYDEQNVIDVVSRSAKDKHTFIKIYDQIMADRFFALALEAKKQGVDFAGHYPGTINPIDAAKAGQKSFEHAHLFIKHSNSLADKNRDFYKEYYTNDEVDISSRPSSIEMLAGFDYEKFYELVQVMVKNETYFCPTHITRKYEALTNNENFLNDENLKYIPHLVTLIWKDDVSGMKDYAKKEGHQQYLEDFYLKGLELTGLAHEKGVKILAGTDSYDPYSFPGISLHSELEELVKAGLSPAEALACATINPSEYFQVSQDYGTIEEGKIADILILNKNPLLDIKNTTSMESLFFNGNLYNEKDIDSMKQYVEDNSSGVNGLSISVKMFMRLMRDNRH
ncbi:amidohydrolase family protein [Ascidiimonas aurantiaca]|uniref:amidohydrolase family protein n=1 Tax=Ascidiimonas aurantiaca TaxID=1685432 RepID=UPI0030ECD19F